ncbi:MAG TPA: ABC transporter permease [Thermoanaerobaculia bacterium]|nr:ABC transporter permease [Thermoanaerobaculia bacterium]
MSSPGRRRVAATYRNLHLLRELIKRDFNARFTGSALGLTWAVLQPLSLVILYWFVFTFMIPGGRAGGTGDHYIYFLIAGLIPWLGVNEGVIRSTTSIVDNAAIVRKLPLRSELLVVVPNASALIFECVGLAIFLTFSVVKGGSPRLLWLLPFALAIQLTLQLGLGFFLAAMYVFFRDLTQVIGFVLSIIFYLSPILYPVGGRFEKFFFWNPLTALLGLFRSAMLASPLPAAGSIVFLLIVTAAVLTTGLFFFRRTRPTLVDLI